MSFFPLAQLKKDTESKGKVKKVSEQKFDESQLKVHRNVPNELYYSLTQIKVGRT